MVCVTPDTVEPAFNVPDDAREQVVYEITDVPLELALPTEVLLKKQLGLVFKVKASVVPYVGVPVAVSTIVWEPVLVKVPDAEKVTPLAVAVIA